MSLADRYVFFNQHLNLPRFTSEDEVRAQPPRLHLAIVVSCPTLLPSIITTRPVTIKHHHQSLLLLFVHSIHEWLTGLPRLSRC